MYLKESRFPDCWKVSSMVPIFKHVREKFETKTTTLLVFFLWLVVFKKLVNNRIVDHSEKCGVFSNFQYGFRSSWSTVDLLAAIFDKIARVFKSSWATWAVALDISKAFDRVWHAGLLQNRKSYGKRLRVVLDGKSWQEYPVNAGVPQYSILGLKLFLLYINDLPDDVTCNIVIYADDTNLYFQYDQASDIWQKLELASFF